MSDHVLIRGARIIDGTGAPWFVSDLRVRAGRIADIGPDLAIDGAKVIDAGGRYLAPGFIDAHCHDDLICLREPSRVEKAMQGVTTLVVGNCSFSLYPKTANSAESLRQHFSSLLGEIDPGEIFDSFSSYRDALHAPRASRSTSFRWWATPRCGSRCWVMTGAPQRRRNAPRCRTCWRASCSDGAAGLSLGLVYPPSAYADAAELLALAQTTSAHGKIVAAHIRSYEDGLGASIDEFIGILKSAKAPGLLSHLQSAGRPNWGKIPKALEQLEAARLAGVDVSFDMYPYLAGSSYILQLLPPEALEGGLPSLMAKLADPQTRESLRQAVEETSPDPHAANPRSR